MNHKNDLTVKISPRQRKKITHTRGYPAVKHFEVVPRYPAGRRCKCGKILTVYNPGPRCFVHKDSFTQPSEKISVDCKVHSCDGVATGLGYCPMHYQRFYKY